LQFLRRVASVRINVMMRTKFPRQRFLVPPSTKRYRLEAHLPCVLNSEVSESANAVHGYHVADLRPRIA
jgi:hypothetical protein